ncbi:MAG: cardiolipin synthase [bacterium]
MDLRLIIDLIYPVVYITNTITLAYLIYEDRDPADTAFWAITIILFPLLGIIGFFFFGRDWRRGTISSRRDQKKIHAQGNKFLPSIYKHYFSIENDFYNKNIDHWTIKIATLNKAVNEAPVFSANSVKILPSGKEGFASLINDLKSAKKFIHLGYFIWEKDILTTEIMNVLLKKLAEKVEVRISYDFLGSIAYSKKELNILKKAGAQVKADVTDIGRFNYRNHRKVAIIDGEIGYTGGINIGQEYIDGGKSYPHWRDTFVRVTGPVVLELQKVFTLRWNIISEENLFSNKYYPLQETAENSCFVQSNHSSSELYWESVRDAYLLAILSAKKRVLIQSPYFIPDPALYAALETASLSGVDVKLIMTGWPDKKVAWWAAQTFFERLLKAGMKIYYYEKGFYHTKALSVDEDFVSIGTTNFDVRSFTLQRENTLFFYDNNVCSDFVRIFNDDLKYSKQFTLNDYKKLKISHKVRNSLCKLLSNLF